MSGEFLSLVEIILHDSSNLAGTDIVLFKMLRLSL
jgi:hypothetical protein